MNSTACEPDALEQGGRRVGHWLGVRLPLKWLGPEAHGTATPLERPPIPKMPTKSSGHHKPSSLEFHREDFPFYWVARVNALYEVEMERALKLVDCDIPTWRVLAILNQQGTCSVSDIATHAIAKLSTVTRIVYRMKDEGLVTTATAPHDGRVTEVTLTAAGERAMQRVKDATNSMFERSFHGLTPAKIAKINELLQILFQNLST
jgi:DNA-binding MarR family transcriptional regulator